jgi:4'-phosphopantetheinyl transferase
MDRPETLAPDAPWLGPGRRVSLRGAPLGARVADVDIWFVRRVDDAETLDRLRSCLAPDERAALAGRRFDSDRRLHVTAHGAKRTALGLVLSAHPRDLRFRVDLGGKPRLCDRGDGVPGAEFSLSHAADLVLLAVSRTRGVAVGADVERVDAAVPVEDLERLALTPEERAAAAVLPRTDLRRRLLRVWTRKEAALKAVGCGLAVAPTEVEAGADAAARRVVSFRAPEGARAALVVDLPCPDGFVASLAVVAGPADGRGAATRGGGAASPV